MEIKLIRSKRRTLSLEVTRKGEVFVRAPLHMACTEIDRFVQSHRRWISQSLQRQQERNAAHPEKTPEEELLLRRHAEEQLPQLVSYYAAQMGLYPTGLRITSARTRFGSCSAKDRICFSWRLMEYPTSAIEYVVVHELAHIRYKNHGKSFYELIETYLPDYRARRALLRR